jgi:quinoprotein glucose dehydrogenase
MLVLGWRLISFGGSWYYAIVGAILTAAAIEILRERRDGYWLYLLGFSLTLVWSIWEAGFNTIALLPRMTVFTVILVVCWICWCWIDPRLMPVLPTGTRWRRAGVDIAAVAIVAGLSALTWSLLAGQSPELADVIPATPVNPQTATGIATSNIAIADGDWPNYGRVPGGQRFSPIAQITSENIANLKRTWVFHTGVLPRPNAPSLQKFMFEATPLKVNDKLVLCTAYAQVVAVDAVTGREIWRFDPKGNTDDAVFLACRGVSYAKIAGASGMCAHRILFATVTARMYALDVDTGARCTDFGDNGEIDLTTGMGLVKPGFYYVTSPAAIIRGVAVIGGWVIDNVERGEPSGVVRAFDVKTGELAWAFDVGRLDRTTLPPAGEHYTRGTPNVWAPMSADPELGLVYLPTGNETPDFFGGGRQQASEEFASSIIAVDANTGKMRWHFQTVHHDLWDFDIPAQPVLIDLPTEDGTQATPAVVVATKRGEVFILDRRDGKPLAAIEERAVPQGATKGDFTSRTQPYPDFPALGPPVLTEATMWGATPLDQLLCRIQFRQHRYEGPFTPASEIGSIHYPGSFGVYEWGSVSVDPARHLMFANTSWVALINTLLPREVAQKTTAGDGDLGGPALGTPYVSRVTSFVSPLGIPCNQPPWGHVTAIDLATHKILWRDILGSARSQGPFGRATGFALKLGVPNMGGSVNTAGGVIFVASTADDTFRALDARTGKELWHDHLPAGGQATPMTYLGVDGKQYVVIAAGGHFGLSSSSSDSLIAYALP